MVGFDLVLLLLRRRLHQRAVSI
uniref:Uncharacterized protein n=1 Tax=Arundo donax TaxID=35708 RepID=A0A0A8XS03_ARUDO